ncbi:SET domain containing 2 [Brevipalpus obovatus]|uniref:SET domain containing 2 n=1 Tax=Brevipalpus obovatus TaxID=246614 RepID=UPI003D9F6166
MSSSLPNPKPEKVKSRWTRNSELEFGQGTEQHNGDSKPLDSPSTSHSPLSHNTSANILKPEPEPLPAYGHLEENVYLFERKKSKSKKEMRRMVCNCILTKEERQKGILGCLDDCLNRMLMIECGSRCLLGDHCANKRFQKKQFAKVEPFKTHKKGWGLRALQPIQPGQFIVEYVGEVLDPREFKQRVKRYAKENKEHFYFMALKSDEIIDATVKGNLTRFINHSCDPNGETQKWTVNGELRIGFFACKFIDAGEEITFDYQFQRYGKKAQKCFCESPQCRGYIGSTEVTTIDIDGSSLPSKSRVQDKENDERAIEDEFEDLGLEEEIAKLTASVGLRNRQQTLMLARLMVRAEDSSSRQQLLEVLKATQEMAYLRLFLDYHGLQLLWSWMVDLEDVYLKGQILETLTNLPIPHRTALKDSKVLDIVERWSKSTENGNGSESVSLNALLPVIVEPSSLLVVNVKKEPKLEDQVKLEDQDFQAQKLENGLTSGDDGVMKHENFTQEKEESKSESVENDSHDHLESNVPNESSSRASENFKNEFNSATTDNLNSEIDNLQVEVELEVGLESEVKTKPELNGIMEDSLLSDEAGKSTPIVDFEVCKPKESVKPRETRSASSSSSSGGTTPLVPSSTGEKIIGRRISVKSRNDSKDESNKENASVKEIVKPLPNIPMLAQKLLYMWKDLKEGFRIPRLERQKRLEDEKEADRKTIEMEERRAKGLPLINDSDSKRGVDNRNSTLASILGLRKKQKRPQDDRKSIENNVSSFQPPNSSFMTGESTGPTPPKVCKEAHRMQFEMDLMRKQYEEALSSYHKQMEQYTAMIQQQTLGPGTPQQHIHQNALASLPNTPQQSGFESSHASGSTPNQNSFKRSSSFLSPVTGGTGPPHPPPPPPSLGSMYPENIPHQGYQVANDYPSSIPVASSFPQMGVFNENQSSFPAGSPHLNHINNNSTSSTSHTVTVISDEHLRKTEGNYCSGSSATASPSTHQSFPSYKNPFLIECTNNLNHSLLSDEKAVILTDYGVEYVPIRQSPQSKKADEASVKTSKSPLNDALKQKPFNPIYPPPGTFYITKEGSSYFIPSPFDSHGHQVRLKVFENVSKPHPTSKTKETVSTALPPNWRRAKDSEGNVYYYNRLTKSIQWEIPEVDMSSINDGQEISKTEGNFIKVVVSNADSTSTPRNETLPEKSDSSSTSSSGSICAISTPSTSRLIAQTTTLLNNNDSSPRGSPEAHPLVNGLSETSDLFVNEDSNEIAGTPSHTLPGSYECNSLRKKNSMESDSIILGSDTAATDCSMAVETNDGELMHTVNRRSKTERMEKRMKDRFKTEMSEHIKYCLNPYRKPDCPFGRILSTEHFKYVARKLTHFVMVKELKHCRNIEDLSCSETVKHKAKDYVKKYMAKQGPVYRPESIEDDKKLSPKELSQMTQENVSDDHRVDIASSNQ